MSEQQKELEGLLREHQNNAIFVQGEHFISLRDYFALEAVNGLLACPIQPQSDPEMYARDAYKIADAMLAERAK